MSYTTDVEDVLFEIIDVLDDGMAAKIDSLNIAKAGKQITLDNIRRFYFGDKERIPNQNMPAIVVKGRSFIPTEMAMNNRYRDEIKIEIECYISSDPNQQLTIDKRTYQYDELMDIKIIRYARMIIEILTENYQLNSKVTLQGFDNVEISNLIDYDGLIIKACRIELSILGITNTLS